MSKKSASYFLDLPYEVHLQVGSFLRAFDLAQLQQTCKQFHSKDNRRFVYGIIDVFARLVYPPELTEGFETAPPLFGTNDPVKKAVHQRKSVKQQGICFEVFDSRKEPAVLTFEHLRDMEMLVLVRLLNMPEPSFSSVFTSGRTINTEESTDLSNPHHYYVSKSWCKAALKWLESQEEMRRQQELEKTHEQDRNGKHQKKMKKISRKQQRILSRKLTDVSPPWPNANQDLLCPHGELMRHSSKAARSKRRIMDKHAWKVLKALYPESVPLKCRSLRIDAMDADACWQCLAQCESEKRSIEQYKLQVEQERKKPLGNPLIRAFYVRASRGVPQDRILRPEDGWKPCAIPLKPGVYHCIPRAWCQRWRRYIKSGGIERHVACLPPDATDMLCDVHKLPLLPTHLERYLRGESPGCALFPPSTPLSGQDTHDTQANSRVFFSATTAHGRVVSPTRESDQGITSALLAAAAADGISAINLDRELEAQRQALLNLSTSPRQPSFSTALDRDIQTLVEIVTDEEFSALEHEFWPGMQGTCFTLRFDIATTACEASSTLEWFYKPCRECENDDLNNIMRHYPDCIKRRMVVRNRVRNCLETNRSSTGENWKWKKPSCS